MQEQLYDMLLRENEVTWQDIIYDLIKTEQMNPWDVDIHKLTHRYIETVKQMQETNYFISGKVLLASALLLKIKSTRLVEEDITNFDAFLFHQDDPMEGDLGDFLPVLPQQRINNIPPLGIRTPLARKRKVSVTDLIAALEKALRVDNRRKLRLHRYLMVNKPEIPEKKVDIHLLIEEIYQKLYTLFSHRPTIFFSELNTGKEKQEIILTLLPLLYLHHSKKVSLEQQEAFAEIEIRKGVAG